jgi:hypothetical protein
VALFCTGNLRTNLWNHLTVRNVCLSLVTPTCQDLSLDIPALKLATAVCRFRFAHSSKSGLLVAHGSKMSAETDEQQGAVITSLAVLSRYKRPLAPQQRQSIYLVDAAVRRTDTDIPTVSS